MEQRALEGMVFNIQRYSIHDGPGIRTTVFFKGCPLKCFWCQNPESQNESPEILLYRDKCTSCGKCVAVCPTGASSLWEQSSTIDRSKCAGCGKCAGVCPNSARKLVGKPMTVEQVMREVLKDRKFYDNSRGGVTLSGGEPTVQSNFALKILQSSKEAGLNTVLDTCGYTRWSNIEKLLGYTDLVFYDIKHMNPRRHREGTGRDNSLILANAKRVAKVRPMIVRVPLIPGFNDSFEEVRGIARFVKAELNSTSVQLLPYNKFAEGKYEHIGKTSTPMENRSEEYIRALEEVVAQKDGE